MDMLQHDTFTMEDARKVWAACGSVVTDQVRSKFADRVNTWLAVHGPTTPLGSLETVLGDMVELLDVRSVLQWGQACAWSRKLCVGKDGDGDGHGVEVETQSGFVALCEVLTHLTSSFLHELPSITRHMAPMPVDSLVDLAQVYFPKVLSMFVAEVPTTAGSKAMLQPTDVFQSWLSAVGRDTGTDTLILHYCVLNFRLVTWALQSIVDMPALTPLDMDMLVSMVEFLHVWSTFMFGGLSSSSCSVTGCLSRSTTWSCPTAEAALASSASAAVLHAVQGWDPVDLSLPWGLLHSLATAHTGSAGRVLKVLVPALCRMPCERQVHQLLSPLFDEHMWPAFGVSVVDALDVNVRLIGRIKEDLWLGGGGGDDGGTAGTFCRMWTQGLKNHPTSPVMELLGGLGLTNGDGDGDGKPEGEVRTGPSSPFKRTRHH